MDTWNCIALPTHLKPPGLTYVTASELVLPRALPALKGDVKS